MPLKMGNTLKETNHISIEVELVIDHNVVILQTFTVSYYKLIRHLTKFSS